MIAAGALATTVAACAFLATAATVAFGQEADRAAAVPDSAATVPDSAAVVPTRPTVPGGYDDKPYLKGVFGRILVGGYVEALAAWERADGATEELGVEVVRWNIFTSTQVSRAVTVWGELEFEDGGEEVTLELAQIDVRLQAWLQLRAGVLLVPIGRFNLAHDGPRNEFAARPLVSTELLGVTISQPGLGLFGRFDRAGGTTFHYEAYAVTGYADDLLLDSPDGTRLPAGRRNFEDQNASPAVAGRGAWSPWEGWELGLSGYHGAYNVYRTEGLEIDERRDVAIGVVDFAGRAAGFAWLGEGAVVDVEIPDALTGLNASRQTGAWVDLSRRFARGLLPGLPASSLTAAVRAEAIDFDTDLPGDSRQRLSLGLNLRTSDETVLKLGYARGRSRDRFNNPSDDAIASFALATYF